MLAHFSAFAANPEFTLIKQSTNVCLKVQTLGYWYVTKLHYAAIIWMCSTGIISRLLNDRSKSNAYVVIMCNRFPPFWGVKQLRFSNFEIRRVYSVLE